MAVKEITNKQLLEAKRAVLSQMDFVTQLNDFTRMSIKSVDEMFSIRESMIIKREHLLKDAINSAKNELKISGDLEKQKKLLDQQKNFLDIKEEEFKQKELELANIKKSLSVEKGLLTKRSKQLDKQAEELAEVAATLTSKK